MSRCGKWWINGGDTKGEERGAVFLGNFLLRSVCDFLFPSSSSSKHFAIHPLAGRDHGHPIFGRWDGADEKMAQCGLCLLSVPPSLTPGPGSRCPKGRGQCPGGGRGVGFWLGGMHVSGLGALQGRAQQ